MFNAKKLLFTPRDRDLLFQIWKVELPRPFWRQIFWVERLFLTSLLIRRSISLIEYVERILEKLKARPKTQVQVREFLVLAWLVILAFLLFYPINPSWIVRLIACLIIYVIWGTINYPLCIIFVDRYYPVWKPQSFNRLVILLFINYLQIITSFAYLYLNIAIVIVNKCGNAITRPCDAFYFSIVTITTLGYGDMEPFDTAAKFLVVSEILIGLVFMTLVIATVVNLLSRKDQK